MGWTYTGRPKGMTNLEFFQREFGGETLILDFATIDRRVCYGAFQGQWEDAADTIVGVVILTDWDHHRPENFGYKEMDEFMGPLETKCPIRILDLLSPIPDCDHAMDDRYCGNCSAREWRAASRAYWSKPIPHKGDVVRFANPIAFQDGTTHQVFVCEGPHRFRVGYSRYRITNIRELDYEIRAA